MDLRKYKKKNPRIQKIEIPLSDEEKNKIIEMAEKENLPVATFIRWKILKSP